jgi:uncharacterized protein
VIVLDSGGLYACLDADESDHAAATAVVADDPGPLLLSPFVLAEVDYLVQRRLGVQAEIRLLDDVDAGAYTLVAFGADDVHQATALVKQYADLGIGVADASVAVIAARYRTLDLLCLDERHFRVIRPLRGGDAFRLRPLD